MGLWSIIVPETVQRTNLVLNPSAELNATGYNKNSGGETLIRSLSYARFGIASIYLETTAGVGIEGWYYPGVGTSGIAVSPSTAYTISAYVRASAAYNLALRLSWYTAAGASISSDTLNFTASTIFTRHWLTATSPGTAAFVAIALLEPSGSATPISYFTDGLMLTQTNYLLSYFDGDHLGRWDGLRHASTSRLEPQERSGGRERDLEADFGVTVRYMPGAGMPPIVNNLQPLALSPGALFQSTKVQPRYFDWHLSYTDTTLAAFFKKRKDLIDLLKPDRVSGAQPCLLSYSGAHASKKAYIRARYDGGAEMKAFSADFVEQPVMRLLAEEPFFFEDNQEVAVLDFQDSVSNANGALRRQNGQWKALGTGFDALVNAIAIDKQRGRVYFGGGFTTANGVSASRICYWDGNTFVAMGSGIDDTVEAIAIAPNGDVWVGGWFNNAGGAASHGLARWNVASSTWTQFALGTTNDIFLDLAIDKSGVLYAVGAFTNWNGNANSDNIVKFDGSTWSNLGTGTDVTVRAVKIHPDGKIYIGGDFSTANGVTVTRIAYWNGTTFVALTVGGSTGANNTVYALAIDRAGRVYASGIFTTIGGLSVNRIAVWDGSQFYALGNGINAQGDNIEISDRGILYVTGSFTQAGDLTVDRIAAWNGTTWFRLDAVFPGAVTIFGGLALDGEDIHVGYNTSGSATASGLTTVTNGGTVAVYPIVTLVGPSSGSCTLHWLENQSSGHRLYFNLTVQAGETVTIDLRTGQKSVVSNWRGAIADNPLSNSDFGSFQLLPGANTVAAFITGTTTGVTLQMRWVPRHWSLDGVAV